MNNSLLTRCHVTLYLLIFLPAILLSQEKIVTGGWVFDTEKADVVRNSAIVIRGGKFLEVGADLSGRDLANAEVVRLSDNDYILPGLFDLHAHYNVNLFGRRRRDETKAMPVIYLANGVTTTFPAGEYDPKDMLALRIAINRGQQIGPRLLNSGPYFGPARIGWNPDITKEEIFAEVDLWAERGAAGFKAKRISSDHLHALIERAHWHGLTVTGHLDSGFRNTINPRDAILMGIDRVEHFLGGDAMPAERSAYASLVNLETGTPEFEAIVDLYLKHQVFFDATLTAYGYFGKRQQGYDYWTNEQRFFTPFIQKHLQDNPPETYLQMFDKIFWVKLKTIKAFYDAGGGHLITMGTDHASIGEFLPGFSAHRELHAFVAAGIPPAAAINIATINGARALNLESKFGSIAAGKFADCFVIKGNPIEDIKNTRKVFMVIKSGKVYDSQALLKSVEGKLGPVNATEAADW